MKKFLSIFLLTLGAIFILSQSPVQATTFTFGDHNWFWPEWNNGSTIDQRDVIGHPNLLGGGGLTTDSWGNLTSIYFNYDDGGGLTAGDVFIDVGADQVWDYVITSGNVAGGYNDPAVYSVSINLKDDDSGNYVLSYWDGNPDHYREDHPVGIKSGVGIEEVDNSISFTDFDSGNGQVIFSDLDGIVLGSQPFIIGFAPTCANDVEYERVPEPMTVLLLGLGLLGLGLGTRRKES